MADTARTLTELTDTLFADSQAAGSITPQDMRDAFVTIMGSYGQIYLASNTTAQSSTTATEAILDISWTTTSPSDNVTINNASADRSIQITTTGTYLIQYSVSFIHASATLVDWYIKIGSTIQAGSRSKAVASTTDYRCVSGTTIADVTAADKIFLCFNPATGANLTAGHASITVSRLA